MGLRRMGARLMGWPKGMKRKSAQEKAVGLDPKPPVIAQDLCATCRFWKEVSAEVAYNAWKFESGRWGACYASPPEVNHDRPRTEAHDFCRHFQPVSARTD